MQFKYPEFLWALLTLLIPILIHLFRLRRFKKTPFTNVKLLQKIVSESRRSSVLKKWFLLATRLLLLAAVTLAFAQPFFAEKSALKINETVIYLDDSFSMQAKMDNGTLLQNAVRDLIAVVPKDLRLTVFTNDAVFRDVTLKDIQNNLLALPHSQIQLQLQDIYLKAKTFFSKKENTNKRLVLVSDFQERILSGNTVPTNEIQKYMVQLAPSTKNNISVDSVYLEESNPQTIELVAMLSHNNVMENVPVSLFNGKKLIAKTSAVFNVDRKAKVSFTIPNNETINGKIEIKDVGLSYDDQLFFNIDKKEKIKVLAINGGNANYLQRIFTENEFLFSSFQINALNYSLLESQNVIFLNELTAIPNALQKVLKSFHSNGGSLVVVPSNNSDLNSYNQLLGNFYGTSISEKVVMERNISTIAFSHPLYQNVFEKKVTNFQYPKVSGYYPVKTGAPKLLSFENDEAFLVGSEGFYTFTASISAENSNFKNTPLIVPTLYNMGVHSLKLPLLYHLLGSTSSMDIPIILGKDNILQIVKEGRGFIPMQHSFANKVTLNFNEDSLGAGIYTIKEGESEIKNISFNHPRTESRLVYLDLDHLDANHYKSSIRELFKDLEKDDSITVLWKWFVILALLFLLIEVAIQKIGK